MFKKRNFWNFCSLSVYSCIAIESHYMLDCMVMVPFLSYGVVSICPAPTSMEPKILNNFPSHSLKTLNMPSKTCLKYIASSKEKTVFLICSSVAEVCFHLLK